MVMYFTYFAAVMLAALSVSTERQPANLSQSLRNYTAESAVHHSTVVVVSATTGMDSSLGAINLSRKRPVRHRRGTIVRAQEKSLEDILTDQSLWGKDFPSVLRALPAFGRAGEQQVSVFPHRILGRTKHAERKQTDPNVARLAQQLNATQNLTPRSQRLQAYIGKERTRLKAEVFQLPDDRTFRVSAAEPTGQFLAPGLSIAEVERRLGKEERVTTEVLDDGTDRRPIILTLHHYAGGAIVFVESDVNPNIGSVDRVFLDASKISTSLF
jgi:hypothetical protein